MNPKESGRIITFYSYKGGTGRSMALANVAWILASQGKRVLMVDWDLEAPGLHRYFHPFLEDKSLTSSEGLLDLLMKFEEAAVAPGRAGASSGSEDDPDWYRSFADVSRYVVPLAWPFDRGALDLLPAGKQGRTYPARVNSFNWPGFYDRLGGGVFLEAVKDNMRSRYDYILVDSRTGVSDTAGICTVQLPDLLVVCFTYNVQSIEGAVAVAGSVRAQRTPAHPKASDAIRIFPVPMRVERAERDQLARGQSLARNAFAGFVDHLPEATREEYWRQIEIQYEPYYAYQEILATVADESRHRLSVLTSYERLTSFLTDGEVEGQQPLPEAERRKVAELFLRGSETASIRVTLENSPELELFCDELLTLQRAWDESNHNERFLLTDDRIVLLENNIALQIGLLVTPAFREFWDASRRKAQQRTIQRSAWMHVGAAAIAVFVVGVPLAVSFRGTSGRWADFATAFGAGMFGAAVSSMIGSYRVSTVGYWKRRLTASDIGLKLGAGGFAGVILAAILISDLPRIPLQDGATRPLTLIAVTVLAGYAMRVIPEVFTKLFAVPREPEPKANSRLKR